MKLKQINWGMIGTGDVTEKKSAPAFNKVHGSLLAGVFNRTQKKAESYASRHGINRVYPSAHDLIHDEAINAVYIATPPSSHMDYAIQAMQAGKAVYVEKPMAVSYEQCLEMNRISEETGVPLFVAYYRRSLPYFLKVRELLEQELIGKLHQIRLDLCLAPRKEDLVAGMPPWRVIPEISGGGYFHDMGCHLLDILHFFFGKPVAVSGIASNRAGLYRPEDVITATMSWATGSLFSGSWNFVADKHEEKDEILITGEKGSIRFSGFSFSPVTVRMAGEMKSFDIANPEIIQLPMIRFVVEELQGIGVSPSHGDSGADVNWIMDKILGRI